MIEHNSNSARLPVGEFTVTDSLVLRNPRFRAILEHILSLEDSERDDYIISLLEEVDG